METNKEEKKRITLGILAHVDVGKPRFPKLCFTGVAA